MDDMTNFQAGQFDRIKRAEMVLIKDFMQKCPQMNRYEVYRALSSLREIGISCVAIEICFYQKEKGQ